LIVRSPDGPPRATTSAIDEGTRFSLGELPVGDDLELEVELRSATQRLVGFGRSKGPIEVSADRDAEVVIPIRRPYIYTSGSADLSTIDPTVDSGEEYQGTVALPEAPAIAVTAGGGDMVVISVTSDRSEARLISTSTHTVLDVPAVVLPPAATDAAATRDGHWLVVGHAGGNGLSVVDLEAARGGAAAVTAIPLQGDVGAVAIGMDSGGGERAYALLNKATGPSCTPRSTIAMIKLDDLEATPVLGEAGSPLSDIAASHLAVGVIGADPCNGAIVAIQPDEIASRLVLAEVPNPTSVAVLGDRIWGAGNVPSPNQGRDAAHVVMVSVGIDGSGAARFDLPALQESVVATEIGQPGQEALERLNAQTTEAYDLAILPGGELLALLTHATYHGDVVTYPGPFGDFPVIPEMQFDTWEIAVVTSNGRPSQRVQARCEGEILGPPDAVLKEWACAEDGSRELPLGADFEPRTIAALYGAR
jgi:hypothetical protein